MVRIDQARCAAKSGCKPNSVPGCRHTKLVAMPLSMSGGGGELALSRLAAQDTQRMHREAEGIYSELPSGVFQLLRTNSSAFTVWKLTEYTGTTLPQQPSSGNYRGSGVSASNGAAESLPSPCR